jgi:DNA-binding response OmpR family regulator
MKALIIDDSKFQRLAIQRALSHAGYEVATASDGEEGLQTARTSRPDLIVLDMMLPKVSGIDVLRALRGEAATQTVPVIVLTGLSDRNKEKLIAEGASEFLEKSDGLLKNDCGSLMDAIARVRAGRA